MNQSKRENIPLNEISQILDNFEKKYSSSSDKPIITLETMLSEITFVSPEDQKKFPGLEAQIHGSFHRITTVRDLLSHYNYNKQTINLRGIGNKRSAYILNFIHEFENQQQNMQYDQDTLMNQKLDLSQDKKTISSIISQLSKQLDHDDSLLNQILTEFEQASTEDDIAKLRDLISNFEKKDILNKAKVIESMLNDRENKQYDLLKQFLTRVKESFYKNEISQILDRIEEKYRPSSDKPLITLETSLSDITFVPLEEQKKSSIIESRIHNALYFIPTVGDLLSHYNYNKKTINKRGIGKKSLPYILAFIQQFEKQQQDTQYYQNIIINQRVDLTTDQKAISSIISKLSKQIDTNDSIENQILTQFKQMSTEEEKTKLTTLISIFENENLLRRAKSIESILKDRENLLLELLKTSLVGKRKGVSYEDECK